MTRRSLLERGGVAAASLFVLPSAWSPTGSATDSASGHLDAVEVAPGLVILPRTAWAGPTRPAPDALRSEPDVRFLLVHHSASTNQYEPEDVAPMLQEFHALHTGPDRGWPDIAYNFMIDRFGRVWEARTGSIGAAVRGDATGGNQGFSQLVCLVGNFTDELPTPEAQSSLVSVLAWLADRHAIATSPGSSTRFVSLGSNRHPAGTNVSTPTITGHRTMSLTACPGDAFFPVVDTQLTALVDAHRATTVPSSTVPSSTVPSTTVPSTTVPSTTVLSTTVPSTTVQPSTARPLAAKPVIAGRRPGNVEVAASVMAVAVGLLVVLRRRRSHHRADADALP